MTQLGYGTLLFVPIAVKCNSGFCKSEKKVVLGGRRQKFSTRLLASLVLFRQIMDYTYNSWLIERTNEGATFAARSVPNKVVTIDVWIATGSAREDDATNGISHFLEHMLFKGTARFGVGDLDRHIMQLGGVWNAGTSMDFTHYYVTVAAPYFEEALEAIADMIQHATIDPEEFNKEKLVILEEYRRKQDDPWGWLFDEIYTLSFAKSPYARTVLGTFDSISGLTREMMVDYYRRTYTAEATNVIIAGDIDPARAIERARAYFTDLAPATNPWPWPDPATELRRGTRKVVERDVHETYLAMTWPSPGITAEKEVVALDVLTTILGSGRSSRLHQRLCEAKRLVNEVGLSFSTHKYPGLVLAYATLEARHLLAAMDEARQIVSGVVEELPTAAELEKAKRILKNEFCFATETTSGQSGVMGYYLTLTGSPDFALRYQSLVDATTLDDLLEVAHRYLVPHEPAILAAVPAKEGAQEKED